MENLKESAELAAGKLDPKAEVVVICKMLKARRKDMGLNQKQFAEPAEEWRQHLHQYHRL